MEPENNSPIANPVPESPPATPPTPQQEHHDNSENTRTIVTALLLLLFMPAGLIVMWLWPKWKTWVKILITLICLIPFLLILLAIFLIGLNPARNFSQANDTQRKMDVAVILDAIAQSESLPASLQSAPRNTAIPIQSSDQFAGIALCTTLVPTYIAELPHDPVTGNFENCQSFNTGYTLIIEENSTGGIPTLTISATPQFAPSIKATR